MVVSTLFMTINLSAVSDISFLCLYRDETFSEGVCVWQR